MSRPEDADRRFAADVGSAVERMLTTVMAEVESQSLGLMERAAGSDLDAAWLGRLSRGVAGVSNQTRRLPHRAGRLAAASTLVGARIVREVGGMVDRIRSETAEFLAGDVTFPTHDRDAESS